jgi:hypothetical protein
MASTRHRVPRRATALCLLVTLLGAWFCGCGGSQPATRALDRSLADSGLLKSTVGRFAGKVTIDGVPPGNMGYVRTLVLLWDPKKIDDPHVRPNYTWCNDDGTFEFTTYEKGDGVSSGSYIVGFVQFEGGRRLQGQTGYRGPDRLKNLYNDPDKNKDIPEFRAEITPPGKTDWEFKLEVQGKEPVESPGPHAVTTLVSG